MACGKERRREGGGRGGKVEGNERQMWKKTLEFLQFGIKIHTSDKVGET